MEMIRSDVHVPSGFEVESAVTHLPSGGERSQGMTSLTAMRSKMTAKMGSWTSMARERMHGSLTTMDEQLRANPAKWAGIAAGAGFILGLSGRLMRHRRKALPSILVIQGC